MHTTTVVIGAGRVGRTVAARLTGARLYGRGQQPDLDDCRRLLIATPHAEIERVCQALAPPLDPAAAGAPGGVGHPPPRRPPGARARTTPRPDRLRPSHAAGLARAGTRPARGCL